MSDADAIRVSTRIELGPDAAFRIFTEEVDAWWRRGPRFRWVSADAGRVAFEGGAGGRFVERDADGREAFEVGRIQVWDPPRRLVFDFRARAFEPGESTEVEVVFEPDGEHTRVTVEHRGWAALADDHPARHGMDATAFRSMMGMWWAELLTSARRHAKGD